MKISIFLDIPSCNPIKFNRRFGGTYRINLHGRSLNRRYHKERLEILVTGAVQCRAHIHWARFTNLDPLVELRTLKISGEFQRDKEALSGAWEIRLFPMHLPPWSYLSQNYVVKKKWISKNRTSSHNQRVLVPMGTARSDLHKALSPFKVEQRGEWRSNPHHQLSHRSRWQHRTTANVSTGCPVYLEPKAISCLHSWPWRRDVM